MVYYISISIENVFMNPLMDSVLLNKGLNVTSLKLEIYDELKNVKNLVSEILNWTQYQYHQISPVITMNAKCLGSCKIIHASLAKGFFTPIYASWNKTNKVEKQEQIGDSIINLSSLVGHSYNIWIYVSIFDFLASKRISNSILNDMNYIERTFSHSRHLSRYTFRRIYHRLLTLHPIWHYLCWYTTIYIAWYMCLIYIGKILETKISLII